MRRFGSLVLVVLALLAIGIAVGAPSYPEMVNAAVESINTSLPSWLPIQLPAAKILGLAALVSLVLITLTFFVMGASADRRFRRAEQEARLLQSWIQGRIEDVEAQIATNECLAEEARRLGLRENDFKRLVEAISRAQNEDAEEIGVSIDESAARREELEEGLAKIKETNAGLENKLRLASGSYDALHRQIADQRSALESLREQREKLEATGDEIRRLEEELAEAQKGVEDLEKLRQRMEELERGTQELKARTATLSDENTGLDVSADNVEKVIKEVTKDVEQMESYYDKEEYGDLDSSIRADEEAVEDLADRIAKLGKIAGRVADIKVNLVKIGDNGSATERDQVSAGSH